MKVIIEWRDFHKPEDPIGISEVPDNLEEFLAWSVEHGRFHVIPPGDSSTGKSIFCAEAHPDLWTLCFENDYD